MEPISKVLTQRKRNKFRIRLRFHRFPALEIIATQIKNEVLRVLKLCRLEFRMSCRNLYLAVYNKDANFQITETEQEKFFVICIKEMANDRYLKLTKYPKSEYQFWSREILCFHQDFQFTNH